MFKRKPKPPTPLQVILADLERRLAVLEAQPVFRGYSA